MYPICKVEVNDGYTVFKSSSHPNFRDGNGIQIHTHHRRTLNEWEHIFWKHFSPEKTQHRHFSFYMDKAYQHILSEAHNANYNEINSYPIYAIDLKPFDDLPLPKQIQMIEIKTELDWKRYHQFRKKLHPTNEWVLGEGFQILKKINQKLQINRFVLKDCVKAIKGSIAVIKINNFIRIEMVEVSPDYRRKGLGTAMVEYALIYARNKLYADYAMLASANTQEANNLYQKLGFKNYGEKVVLMKYPRIRMVRSIEIA